MLTFAFDMTNILYIDTSGLHSQIMLFNDEKILASRTTSELNHHAQTINTHVKEILNETGMIWKDISAVSVLNGPGSYTGLRIGLASAKGFCYAHDIPLILLNHFELLHHCNVNADNSSVYVLNTRANEYFFKENMHKNTENEIAIILTKDEILEKIALTGQILFTSDENLLQNFEKINVIKTSKKCIQSIVFQYFTKKIFYNLINSEPFYIKDVHINKIKNP